MTTDTILAIVGLIVSVYLGYLGLKYTLKYRKKTEIIFLKNSSISLFKTIVKNLDDIEINFKGKRINENLILFKGTFFNSGNIDIEKSIIHKPLELELPPNYSWVSHKLIDNSEGLEIKTRLEVDANKLIFEWDLLKEGEFFTFDSLIEYKSGEEKVATSDIGKSLFRNIKINHRITDLKKVDKENAIPTSMGIGGLIFASILLLGISIGGFYFSVGQLFYPSYEVLSEVNLETGKHYVTFTAEDSLNITLLDKDENELKTLPNKELIKKIGNTILIKKSDLNYWTLFGVGFVSLIYLILWLLLLITEIRDRKLYRKLKNVAKKHDELDLEERRSIGFTLFEFRTK